jgi:hypothetical protein
VKPEREVIAINRGRRQAMLEDGAIIPVVHWIDAEGEFCEPDDAKACVAGGEGLGWWAIDLDAYDGKPH